MDDSKKTIIKVSGQLAVDLAEMPEALALYVGEALAGAPAGDGGTFFMPAHGGEPVAWAKDGEMRVYRGCGLGELNRLAAIAAWSLRGAKVEGHGAKPNENARAFLAAVETARHACPGLPGAGGPSLT